MLCIILFLNVIIFIAVCIILYKINDLERKVLQMANFLATQIINGKLTWTRLTKSTTYNRYADQVVDVLESRGYMIDENGNCVRISSDID